MNMMTAIAVAPAIAMPSSARATPFPADRENWDRAMAAFKRAENAWEASSSRIDAIEETFFELRKNIPHTTVGPDFYTGRTQPVSTEDISMVAQARRLVKDLSEGRRWHEPGIPGLEEHTQFCRALAAAEDKRDAQIEALDAELGYSKANDAHDTALDKMVEARDRLIEMPAPDGEALLWKLDWLLFSDGAIWQKEYVAQTAKDACRMLGNSLEK
jgi:hypothetical protein